MNKEEKSRMQMGEWILCDLLPLISPKANPLAGLSTDDVN